MLRINNAYRLKVFW